jgi:hypothetical protein
LDILRSPQNFQIGDEFRMGKGPYFVWPADLQV